MLIPHNSEPGEGYVKVRVRRKEDFQFLNVDLEIESGEDLQPLLDELGKRVMVLYHQGFSDGHDHANLEISSPPSLPDIYRKDKEELVGGADILIAAFCRLIKGMSSASRKIWNTCHRKEFDVGFECGNTGKSYQTVISTETIRQCGEIDAAIRLTVYPFVSYEIRPVT